MYLNVRSIFICSILQICCVGCIIVGCVILLEMHYIWACSAWKIYYVLLHSVISSYTINSYLKINQQVEINPLKTGHFKLYKIVLQNNLIYENKGVHWIKIDKYLKIVLSTFVLYFTSLLWKGYKKIEQYKTNIVFSFTSSKCI